MNKFVLTPNLPVDAVKTVLMGDHGDIALKLEKLGIEIITLNNNGSIDFSVRNHADTLACNIGGGRIFLDSTQLEAADTLRKMGMTVIDTEIKGEYPGDVKLNCALMGDTVIYSEYTHPDIKNMLFEGIRSFKVRQGYCRCSVCIVTDNAIITDDIGIYKTTKHFMDVLYVRKGDIILDGKDYGFIGGATAKLDKNTMLFFGNPDTHRDSEEIKAFLRKHEVEPLPLFEGKLVDIGGVVQLR